MTEWRWGLMPSATLLHIPRDNGRTLCNRRITGEGEIPHGRISGDWFCPVCARRAHREKAQR